MAVTRPAAVVKSASEMPGATARRLAEPAVPSPEKASMMPQTVPKRPMKRGDGAGGGEPGHAFFGAANFFSGGQLHIYCDGLEAFQFAAGIGIAGAGADLALKFAIAKSVDGGEGEPAEAKAWGLATPWVARKMRRNWSPSRWTRPKKPSFWKIMAHETTEKMRRSARTPRATHPVCWRMLPISVKRNAANRKMVLPLSGNENLITSKP